MTKRVKAKLDAINYRISSIVTYFIEDGLLKNGTYKNILSTSFTETILGNNISVVSDFVTLEMLYVRYGPMNFMEIEDFFKPYEEDKK